MITLRAEHLTKKFNQHLIFSELSFEHTGGILGISGANGSGKSTLLKCLAYLIRPNSGSIIWHNSRMLMEQKKVKSIMGYAAPYIDLYAELTVQENLRFLVEAGGASVKQNHLTKLMERVQIPDLRDQFYGSLSTGQQQRAKLAAALVRDPQILMLDEPGSNLDKKGHKLVTDIVQNASGSDKLVFLASNDPNEIALCDKIIELS